MASTVKSKVIGYGSSKVKGKTREYTFLEFEDGTKLKNVITTTYIADHIYVGEEIEISYMNVKKFQFIIGARSRRGELMLASDDSMIITAVAFYCIRDSFLISTFVGYWIGKLSLIQYENIQIAIRHFAYFAIAVCSIYLYKFIKFTKDYKSGVAALEESSKQVQAA
ncbi:hypothetical protein ABMA70_04250 [Halobacteriovorax sp. XZX-3]|uniref:hypothetical protein n=1 Tax=unclassified Halobacteriovorax TaxID=2639665 RepID=UPI000CD0B248|nr:hypothetical protein [Halobacteriovorax sp. DA5]POB15285.1 hypothetical protein C0Z22_02545 [Halobacteriovorax sp. DA5]